MCNSSTFQKDSEEHNYPEFIHLAKNILFFYVEIHVADDIFEEN